MALPREVTLSQLEAYLHEIATYYEIARKNGDGSYHCACPLHGGKDSLHISATDRILVHCFGNEACTQLALHERMRVDGFDLNVICHEATAKKKGKAVNRRQNNPAHDQAPLDIRTLTISTSEKDGTYTYHPVTQAYAYTNDQGLVVFYVLRANTTIPKAKGGGFEKHIRPYSSFKNEQGQDFWDFGLMIEAKRPLYNLKELVDRRDAHVLLVEGEKTADFAKRSFPDYVVMTYSGGMGNYTKTDFMPLKGRTVTLWPDNSEAGIRHFLGVAALIDPLPRIVMQQPLKDRPENWDLADEVSQDMFTSHSLLEHALIVSVSKISPEDAATIVEKYNKFLRVLWIGGSTYVYDISKTIDDPWLPHPYHSFNDLPRHYAERILVPVRGKKYSVEMPAVKVWEQSEDKITTYGILYDPETEDEIITRKGMSYTNKFKGFDYPPKECDPIHYACFERHIRYIMSGTEAEFVMCFIAHMIQHPKEKPGVLIILIGKQATGKTIIGEILEAMLGMQNIKVVDGRSFNSKWTGQFSGKLLIYANEYSTKEHNPDFMNTFITDHTITLEHKGKPLIGEISYHRIIATTNEDNFQLSLDDRRYFPIRIHNPSIDSANKPISNKAYYRELDNLKINETGLCGLHHYLKNYKIAMDVQIVPQTEFRYEGMKPVNPVHAIILEICESGSMPEEFGLTYMETQLSPYSPQYPSKVLRKHMRTMVKTMSKLDGPKVTPFLMDFLFPERLSKDSNVQMRFVRHGRPKDSPEVDNDRVFEFPALGELRNRYNRLVDPKRKWGPPILRAVKDTDSDNDSPI